MKGKGMRATLNDGHVDLESSVHGTAVPNKIAGSQ
jgi:hypothetical protein